MIKAFPKIFQLGTRYIVDIFKDEVEVTEKVDGSQFVFGKHNLELEIRSKGQMIVLSDPPKMFKLAVEYVKSIEALIPDNLFFYCEYLNKPKHNTLCYSRVPHNYLALFGVSDIGDSFIMDHEELLEWANRLGIEAVPLIMRGKINSIDEFKDMIDIDSFLGNVKVEGVVVKNYHRPFLLGNDIPIPVMAGKYVSEKFKEVHGNTRKQQHTPRGKWDTIKDNYRSEARWQKSIQHLKEKDVLENAPRDIGKLLLEIKRDITEEEQETIKKFLWKEFSPELLRKATAGFPEWYKEQLLKNSLNETL